VRDILQNSADPKNWWGNPGLGFLDNVHRQGAGMLDIDDAILSDDPDRARQALAGRERGRPRVTQADASRTRRSEAVTYNLSFVNALSTGGSTRPGFFLGNATVAFSSPA
jgi:minor extracellular serine protease Vpr